MKRLASGISAAKGDAVGAWIAYGVALNIGRAEFPSDAQFGEWVSGNLPPTEKHERLAAMWAAANPATFADIRAEFPNARTVRGWHGKWKDNEAKKPANVAKPAPASGGAIGITKNRLNAPQTK